MASLVAVIQHAGHKRASQGPISNKLGTGDMGRPTSSQSIATQMGKDPQLIYTLPKPWADVYGGKHL